VSGAKDRATLIGAGAAACAACCAGPIIGLLAALGIGALAAALVFGTIGLVLAAMVGALLVARRRRRLWKPVALLPPRL
jgi:hypothetical protein